jgi:RimJ/RimL family protein N-acetyltransferase
LLIETPRLLLRSFEELDIEPFAAYRSDPDVARYQSWDVPYTVAQAAAFVAAMKEQQPGQGDEWYQIAVELKQKATLIGDAIIGDCAFHLLAEDARQAEIGFTLAQPYQGHGYAAEAVHALLTYLFDTFDLHRVVAVCDADNLGSVRLLERIGMRREAHFVENVWFKGAWGSEYSYALLRREWGVERA